VGRQTTATGMQMAHMYRLSSWRALQGETVCSAQGTPIAAALSSFFCEELLLPTPAGSSGISADVGNSPRKEGWCGLEAP